MQSLVTSGPIAAIGILILMDYGFTFRDTTPNAGGAIQASALGAAAAAGAGGGVNIPALVIANAPALAGDPIVTLQRMVTEIIR
eukprot:2508772-Amphidinium_carterae.1